jgi:hypothetical protein
MLASPTFAYTAKRARDAKSATRQPCTPQSVLLTQLLDNSYLLFRELANGSSYLRPMTSGLGSATAAWQR